MHTVQTLLALQELNITLRETEIVHGTAETASLKSLKARVAALRAEIGPEALARFDRLSRQGLAVVKVEHDTCQGCNIGIPRGDINRIVSGKLDPICPNCGKFVIVHT